MSEMKFDQWAIVEVMGHQQFAGRVTEQVIGGTSFIRVDVPEVAGRQSMTKLLGSSSIYAMTIVDEETARVAARRVCNQPMEVWTARRMLAIEATPATELSADTNDDGRPY